MERNLLLIDSRGTRQACREHGIAFIGKRCPKCVAKKKQEAAIVKWYEAYWGPLARKVAR